MAHVRTEELVRWAACIMRSMMGEYITRKKRAEHEACLQSIMSYIGPDAVERVAQAVVSWYGVGSKLDQDKVEVYLVAVVGGRDGWDEVLGKTK